MLVSFCIPAHDEEALIGPTVAALVRAGDELGIGHEVVVACDACTDATRAAAEAAGARAVVIDKRHIAAARNAAAEAAQGSLLIFVDADTIVPVEAVRQALAAVKAGAIGGGAPAGFDGRVPLYARIILLAVNALFRILKLAGGCFFFCTRDGLDAVGGWDEGVFAGEEVALARALKRHGRFVLIRERVVTSGRKLRTHSAREILGVCTRAVFRPSIARDRSALDIWYGPRRNDPGPGVPPAARP
ncbi:MAG: glycosyltransferase [Phycisphaerales bacterium]|nr:glycosyltransferase [Phycisphaerales bacterium]